MAGRDGPSRPPGQLSLLDFRLGVKRAPPEVDRAVIEAQVEARRQARLQREEAAKSATDAAKRPLRHVRAQGRLPRRGRVAPAQLAGICSQGRRQTRGASEKKTARKI